MGKRLAALLLCMSVCLSSASCGADGVKPSPPGDGSLDSQEEIIDEEMVVMPEDVSIDTQITVSPINASQMNGGVFEGWGTSLCWWANRIGYSDKLSDMAADLFYSEDGLRLNIMRYNIGGGDDPTHNHITRTDSDVPGWLVYDEDSGEYQYDYDADSAQLNVLKRCREAAGEPSIVEVFSNSPPYFMTVSGCSSGGFDPNSNNLRDDCYEEFAEYLAHVTNYIQNELGIEVASVSPMNEPNTNFWGANSYKQEGCHFDAGESQSRIIELTYDCLRKYELDNVIVAASDETSTELQIEEYKQYSDRAKECLGRINTHTYNPTRIAELGQLAKDEGFNLWMSEVDGNGMSGENAGEMSAGLWLAEKIIYDINSLSPSAWVLWQAIDKHICEEGYKGRQDSGMVDTTQGFWGTAVADHDSVDIILTQKYYALGQFTRYIRPGSRIIHCGGSSLSSYNPETKELTVVAVNSKDSVQTINCVFEGFKSFSRVITPIRTSGSIDSGEHWAELEAVYAYDSGFVAGLKENSVTTFIVKNVELSEIELEEVDISLGTVSGSLPWNNGSDTADKAIDNDPMTFFDGVKDGWLEIDLGGKKEFSVIGFAPRSGFEQRMVGGCFYGSNNSKDWELIYEVTAAPSSGYNYKMLDKTLEYRYIRYSVPSGRADGATEDYLCNIAEIKLYKAAVR